jgi:hypothetical protein
MKISIIIDIQILFLLNILNILLKINNLRYLRINFIFNPLNFKIL